VSPSLAGLAVAIESGRNGRGEKPRMEGGKMRAKKFGERWRVGRSVALGTGGLSAAVALLMVLSPAAAAAGVHPALTMAPPYLGSVSSGSSYASAYGCASASGPALKWTATTGFINGAQKAAAKTCGKTLAGVAIPFKVSSGGNHSIMASIKTSMSLTSGQSSGGCPKSLVKYPPALYSYSSSQCYTGTSEFMDFSAYVVDLNNNSWFSNYSFQYNASYKSWSNTTTCYNYGTPSCYNSTGWSNFSYGFGYNAMSTATFSGAGAITMWTNGTYMVAGHHYVWVISCYIGAGASTSAYNVAGHWTASASATESESGTGLGEQVASITVT
jgi:hypothetical protein